MANPSPQISGSEAQFTAKEILKSHYQREMYRCKMLLSRLDKINNQDWQKVWEGLLKKEKMPLHSLIVQYTSWMEMAIIHEDTLITSIFTEPEDESSNHFN